MITNNRITFGAPVAEIIQKANKIDPYIGKQIRRCAKNGLDCSEAMEYISDWIKKNPIAKEGTVGLINDLKKAPEILNDTVDGEDIITKLNEGLNLIG